MPSDRPVLAIGIDAAEPTLVRALMDQGQMPALAGLRDDGQLLTVPSPAGIGSGAVWPTFYTGRPVEEHGVHSGWRWKPDRMRVEPLGPQDVRPFWEPLAEDGVAVGALDVPLCAHLELERGFDISQWGAHEKLYGALRISPPSVANAVEHDHPFASRQLSSPGPRATIDRAALAAACLSGVQLRGDLAARLLEETRPDLAVVVFTEVHHSAHELWDTVPGEPPDYDGPPAPAGNGGTGLVEIYREIDRQIGRLAAVVGDDATVVVFSLHGMRTGRGFAILLDPVMRALGFSVPAGARGASAGTLGRRTMAAVKRRTPQVVKRVYHGHLPDATRLRLAQPTMVSVLDWSRTRAFALPTDQNGWIRVNLEGRERDGIVARDQYEAVCREIEESMRGLVDENGQPLVEQVFRPNTGGVPPATLPDVIVHWSDAAGANPVRVRGLGVESWPEFTRFTGQHSFEGFCVARGVDGQLGDSIRVEHLHRLLLATASDEATGGAAPM